MTKKIRGIVTGHHPDGTSTILFESDATEVLEVPGWGAGITELWSTDESPVDLNSTADRVRPMSHDPRPNGSLFRVVEVPPESEVKFDTDTAFAAMGSHNRPENARRAQHPTMQRTDSLDHILVAQGEMFMVMGDGSETLLTPGDCVVQQGTDHAWANRGTEPCVIFAVLPDASKPTVLAQSA